MVLASVNSTPHVVCRSCFSFATGHEWWHITASSTSRAVYLKIADREEADTFMPKPASITERVSDDAIRTKTGKTWSQWITVLDRVKALDKPHKEIAAWLRTECGLSAWWSQTVTVGYEQAKGLRVLHQKPTGFEISVSRTFGISPKQAFAAWSNGRARRSFLDEPLSLRTSTSAKSLRFNREDGTIIEVRIYPKSADKCQVTVQHSRLRSAASASSMKKYWATILDSMKALIEE